MRRIRRKCDACACLRNKEQDERVISIDAYCNVSKQGNLSSHIWHVHRRTDLYDDQLMSVPHGVWLDMLDRYIDMPVHARRDRLICSNQRRQGVRRNRNTWEYIHIHAATCTHTQIHERREGQ